LYCVGQLNEQSCKSSTLYHEQIKGHNKEVTIISAAERRREKTSSMHTLFEKFCIKSAAYLTPHKFL
jgi:hypothetical protein